MNNQFKIVDKKNRMIVLSLDNSRLDEIYNDVEKRLSKKGYKGLVLFDLLISNGLSNNRFISLSFDKGKFIFSTIKQLKKIDEEITDYTNSFYFKHKEYISNSILPRTEKQKILNYVEQKSLIEA